jgi:hypothetical protein
MIINGRAFEGTCDYELTDRRLTECTGTTISCIPTFHPIGFPHARVVFNLLLVLYRYKLCCFLTRTYALYVTGRLTSFDGLTTFVALNDLHVSPVLMWLFQRISPGVTNFVLNNDLQFTLLHADEEHEDLFHYRMLYDNITLQVSFFGIDTTER